nr:hypothetical protein [uncultured Eisenbergiella sp.]
MNIKKVLKHIPFVDDVYIKYKWREQKVSFGKENPDKTFFVVRRATCKVGLFSYVMTNMGLVKRAVDRGYIPVIDMQGNANTYLEDEEVGRKNAWEFYFEQPCGYTLEDISKSKNVILSSGLIREGDWHPGSYVVGNPEKCKEWRAFFNRYLIVNSKISQETDAMYKEMFGLGRTLGVLCRGTDYINNRPKNHPIQPEPEEVIQKAEAVMREYKCEWIYLATEDEAIYKRFQEAFGDKLKVTGAKRCADTGNKNINDIVYQRKHDRYIKGKEYLINILLLAKCDCLVAGSVGGTYGALLMSKGYEYQYVYDLGRYE